MNDDHTRIITVARSVAMGLEEKVHCLELVDGPDTGRRYLVGDRGTVIGRAAPADIVIADSEVSRAHCRVTIAGGDLIVTDLSSTNGSYVDGRRVLETAVLAVGSILQIGRNAFKHEWLTGRQLQKSDELDRDLATAASYVDALLPPRLTEGPIRADWFYLPCAKLGGDAFGYGVLPGGRFAVYLIDVSGHGAGAAMHSVAVMNLLRQGALPDTDMARPEQVLAKLNAMFQMDRHADMYFTMWYGVYDPAGRRLDFAAAGHHPGYLIPPDRSTAIPLQARNVMIGAMPDRTYRSESVTAPPGSSLVLFSDGAFEIVTHDGLQWRLENFVPLLLEPPVTGLSEPERLFQAVSSKARAREPDDDVSILILGFD